MIVYLCNPVSNPDCTKEACFLNAGPCYHTTNIEFATKDEYGNPISEYWPDEPDA